MSYQAPPQYSGDTQPPMRREIDFGIISEAFQLLTQNWQTYCVAGLVSLLAYIPSQIFAFMPMFRAMGNQPVSASNPFTDLAIQYALMIPASLIGIFIAAGVIKFTLNVIQGLPASTSDIWEGFRDIPGYFATSFIAGIIGLLGAFACCIGSIFTSGLMMFAMPIKVATGVTPSNAISESWSLLKGQWAMAGVFFLVIQLISGLGVIACFIGQAFTYSFGFIAATLLYCRYVGIGYLVPQNPASPYPRGQSGQQYGIGDQPKPQEERRDEPPKPGDVT